MNERSNELIKQLNRLANDRSIPPHARNKIHDAAQFIKNLQVETHPSEVKPVTDLDFNLGIAG